MDEARVLKFEIRETAGRWCELRPREQQVILMRCMQDLYFKEIAAELGISKTTVIYHFQTGMHILGCRSDIRLAFWLGVHLDEVLGFEEAQKFRQKKSPAIR